MEIVSAVSGATTPTRVLRSNSPSHPRPQSATPERSTVSNPTLYVQPVSSDSRAKSSVVRKLTTSLISSDSLTQTADSQQRLALVTGSQYLKRGIGTYKHHPECALSAMVQQNVHSIAESRTRPSSAMSIFTTARPERVVRVRSPQKKQGKKKMREAVTSNPQQQWQSDSAEEDHRRKYLQPVSVPSSDPQPRQFCHMSFMSGVNTDECPQIDSPKNERLQSAKHDIALIKQAEEQSRKHAKKFIKRRLELQKADRGFWAAHKAPNITRADLERRTNAHKTNKSPPMSSEEERMQLKTFLRFRM